MVDPFFNRPCLSHLINNQLLIVELKPPEMDPRHVNPILWVRSLTGYDKARRSGATKTGALSSKLGLIQHS
nr:Hypothetical protein [Aeromonas caviae]